MAGTPSKLVSTARARVGSLTRSRAADDPELIAARRDLAALTLEEHVTRVVATAPPFTPQQVERLGSLLRGGAA